MKLSINQKDPEDYPMRVPSSFYYSFYSFRALLSRVVVPGALVLVGCSTIHSKTENGEELSESQIEKTDVVVPSTAGGEESTLPKETPFEKGIYLDQYA